MREIEFDIRLTANELFAFSMRHAYSGVSGIAGLFISIASLCICAACYRSLDNFTIAALILAGLLFTVIQPAMLYFKSKRQVKANKSINDMLHYRFSEDGIEVSQGEQRADVKWHEIRKKVVAKNGMYLYTSPVRAFIFPKSQCGEMFGDAVKLASDMMAKYRDYDPYEDDDEEKTADLSAEKEKKEEE